MNPAVLNYLQSQQQPNQNMEQAPQQQAPYNPFDSGISKAISSARESLGMTDKQQEKALRRSMLTFGDNIAQQPKQKGFWNNFGSVGRALSPAIMAHDDAEDAALTQNNALANQMLAYQAAEQKRQEDAKQQTWERQHKEAQLGEQRRAHDMMNSRASSAASQGGFRDYNGQSFRVLDKAGQTRANTLKAKAGNSYLAVKNINKSWAELEELSKDNVFQPIGGYSGITNPVKEFFGKYGKKESLQKETAARQNLSTQLGRLNTSLEALTSGGGKLGQGMYDRLKPFFPDIKNDDYETIKAKMEHINNETELYYNAAKLSADLGIYISPYDVDEMNNPPFQGQDVGINSGESGQNFIVMQDQNGQQYSIPRDEVEDAINDGLTPIGQ
jgi:hypothetical protein